jgi:hypothetical protein
LFFCFFGHFGLARDSVLLDRFRENEPVTFGQPDTQPADQQVDAYGYQQASPNTEPGDQKKPAKQRPGCPSNCIDPIQPSSAYANVPQFFHIKPAQYRQGYPHQSRWHQQKQRTSHEGKKAIKPKMYKKLIVGKNISRLNYEDEKGQQHAIDGYGYFHFAI